MHIIKVYWEIWKKVNKNWTISLIKYTLNEIPWEAGQGSYLVFQPPQTNQTKG